MTRSERTHRAQTHADRPDETGAGRPHETGAGRPRRAEALRSNDAILDAALAIIGADDDLNMAAVARQARVSRVTLYSHYATRELLVEAVVRRAVAEAAPLLEQAAHGETDPVKSLTRLLGSSWEALARYRNLHAVASRLLPPSDLHDAHAPLFGPLERLITQGREAGGIRSDLPVPWLIATMLALLHLASEQVEHGAMRSDEAGAVVTSTILSVFTGTADPAARHQASGSSSRRRTASTAGRHQTKKDRTS